MLWDINSVTHSVKSVKKEIDIIETDKKGNETIVKKTVTEKILIINLTHKSHADMVTAYSFNDSQKEQLDLLMDEEYYPMWAELLGGYSSGSGEIIILNSDHILKDIFHGYCLRALKYLHFLVIVLIRLPERQNFTADLILQLPQAHLSLQRQTVLLQLPILQIIGVMGMGIILKLGIMVFMKPCTLTVPLSPYLIDKR